MNLNSTNFVGRLVADPLFTAKKGEAAARLMFRLAVNRIKSEKADIINCVAWGPVAEAGAEHLYKGKEVGVTGELRTNSTQKEDGSWDNFWNISCQTVHYGQDTFKKQQERNEGDAGDADLDAIANKLLLASNKPELTLGTLMDKLVSKGMSQDDALTTAKKYLDKSDVQKDAPKEKEQMEEDAPF